MLKNLLVSCLAAIVMVIASGCATYYKVTVPETNKVYYTNKIHEKGNGVIQFKDEATKVKVTLPNSEIMEITEDQYKANVRPE